MKRWAKWAIALVIAPGGLLMMDALWHANSYKEQELPAVEVAAAPVPTPTAIVIQSTEAPPPPIGQIVENGIIPTPVPRAMISRQQTRSVRTQPVRPQPKPPVLVQRSLGSEQIDTSGLFPDPAPRPSRESPRATARPPAPAPAQGTQVWVNTKSGVYHYPGARWYGNTKNGRYMSESEAQSNGYQAAENNQ